MTSHDLVNELFARSEDLLTGIAGRTAARSMLLEELALDYPTIPARARTEIVTGVIHLLDADDFFGREFCGDPFAEEPEEPEEIEAD